MKIHLSLVFLFTFFGLQSQVKLWEEQLVIPTYEVKAPDKNPFFFRKELYQGASRCIYPYALNDNLGSIRSEKKYLSLNIENEYIKITVLPELGGKLYDGLDKTNGYHFFYRNNVVKPANIGMPGAWTSGGIEWCVVHHHRASSFLPVDYFMVDNEDGSRTIWFGETELRHRMRWTIALTVFPGKSYVRADVKIVNRTPETNSFLYWANVATHANPDYRVIFPSSTKFGVYHAKNSFTHWPISHEIYNGVDYRKGVDLSWWKNHPEPISFFAHDLQEDFMGGYDYGKDAGTVHVANHHIVKGAKLWEWGPGEEAQVWDKVLSDTDGPYAEIMVGAFSDNQPDYSWIRPYEVKSFSQYWYPVRDIKGFKTANLHAAINLEVGSKGEVFGGASVTGLYPASRLQLWCAGKLLAEKQDNLNPGHPAQLTTLLPVGATEQQLQLVLLDQRGDTLISWKPQQPSEPTDLPPAVTPPPSPSAISTNEELFLAGQRIRQFYNPTLDPLPYMMEALHRDSLDARVNTWMGNEAWRNGKYAQAAGYFRAALKRTTAQYTRPADGDAWYGLGLSLRAMGRNNEAMDAFYRASWDQACDAAASYQLAEIYCSSQRYQQALEAAHHSLQLNALNNQAIALKAAVLRYLNRMDDALAIVSPAYENDPLDFRLGHELVLCLRALGREEEARNSEIDLEGRMQNNVNNYLELADDYLQAGLDADALLLLKKFVQGNTGENINPLVYYTLAYLSKPDAASEYLRAAVVQPIDYVFPYILSQRKILDWAVEQNPADAKAWYYLGNLLFDRQPDLAMGCWEKAVAADPQLAQAYRNLGWAAWYHQQNLPKAIAQYEKAIAANSNDPVYFYELDRLYARVSAPVSLRLSLMEAHHAVLEQRNDALLREVMVLTLAGQFEKAAGYLAQHTFHIREGDISIRDIHLDVHLLMGKKLLEEEKYAEALKEFELAGSYPDNYQLGKTLQDDRFSQVSYFIAKAAQKTGDKKKAANTLNKAAASPVGISPWAYYKALALRELGREQEATALLQQMVDKGKQDLQSSVQADFFAKFGEQRSREEYLAAAHFLLSLGLEGLGNTPEARVEVRKAVDLWNSNPWANCLLNDLR